MTEPVDEDDGLSEYERRFVEAYMGDAHGIGAHAMLLVSPDLTDGSAASQACKLLKRPQVRKALRDRVESDPLVASRLERLRLLTRIARGEELEERPVRTGKRGTFALKKCPPTLRDRMEACAALSKAAGEHLPEQADDAAAKLAALLSSMTVQQIFSLANTPEKGQTQ